MRCRLPAYRSWGEGGAITQAVTTHWEEYVAGSVASHRVRETLIVIVSVTISEEDLWQQYHYCGETEEVEEPYEITPGSKRP